MEISELSLEKALTQLDTSIEGLSAKEAQKRLNEEASKRHKRINLGPLNLLLKQFSSPLVILLLVAMAISLFVGDKLDGLIVLVVVSMSTMVGFFQELMAAKDLAAFLNLSQIKSSVLRDRQEFKIPISEVLAGDIILLRSGDTIAGDALLIESKDLFVDESALTGESFPSEKKINSGEQDYNGKKPLNVIFKGTHVVSGTAKALIVKTGDETEIGKISKRLRMRSPETDFESGLRRFGEMLIRVTLLFTITIFAINVFFHRPVIESLVFALAIAVGMTPELLPAIVSITLVRGARRMSEEHVIVRKLSSIENFGSMDVFCSDKTGTLTEGHVKLLAAKDAEGNNSESVLRHAVLNARFESGFVNPIDQALRIAETETNLSEYQKFDEVPYDFIRKRLSIVVQKSQSGEHLMITKGAFDNVLMVCSKVATANGEKPIEQMRAALLQRFSTYSDEGHRVLAVAIRDVSSDPVITREDEQGMTFEGFLLFHDPPKVGAREAVSELRGLGINFKVITGDNRFVSRWMGEHMGLTQPSMIYGETLNSLSDEALIQQVSSIDIFTEIEPNQKERIILALRKAGHVVGYLGDGINDASALHAADVGVSVDQAVDVAKEAADIVLQRPDLAVLARGVRNGRVIFANTLKYIFITTSANFGNMFSMAGASLFLPFLPLLPKQILLNNFLSDLPALTISADSVDPEQVQRPCRWDHKLIRRFMISFGMVSSFFDFLTFAILLLVLRANEAQFQTSWFIESLMTELFIVMIIRTHRPFFKSRPGATLLIVSISAGIIGFVLPFTAIGALFGLVPLPFNLIFAVICITLAYLSVSEFLKRLMFEQMKWIEK